MSCRHHYHSSVIRPELYNLVNQIEVTLLGFDDRLLRQHRELQWMASDNRAEQRRSSALTVLLTGFPPKATPQERGFMVNWMLEQVDGITKFLKERGYNPEETGADFMMFQALTTDPSTPPAGPDKWSTITLLHFKSWEIRKCFMDHYGGSGGTPYWSNATTPVRNTHIRATPASPQFQRKLEIPLRVVLSALNLVEAEKNQVTILWKTLTIMMPQTQREFDEQATAIARLHYTTESGNLVGTLEVNPYLWDLLKTTPPSWAMADEETTWEHAWNKVVFGVQHELDVAERELYSTAQAVAKGSGKGMKLGRPPRHWTAPTIFSSVLRHVTYRDKNPPATSWSPFVLDPMGWTQFWDKLFVLTSHDDLNLSIAYHIREFLTAYGPQIPPFHQELTPYDSSH